MSEFPAEGYIVALRPIAVRFAGVGEWGDRLQAELGARIVEQAKAAICARLGATTEAAIEILSDLARSQGRELEECAEAVLANDAASRPSSSLNRDQATGLPPAPPRSG